MQHRSMKYFKIASLLIMIHNALLSSKITLRNSWFLHSTLAKINLHREGLVLRMMRNLYTDCSSKVVDDMISFLGIVMSKSELSTFRQTGWCSCSLQVKNKNVGDRNGGSFIIGHLCNKSLITAWKRHILNGSFQAGFFRPIKGLGRNASFYSLSCLVIHPLILLLCFLFFAF